MSSRTGYYLCSVAVCAIVCASSPALADEKRATFSAAPETSISRDLSDKLEQAIGTVPNAPRSAGEARRNERRAMTLAQDILHTEGYYSARVEAAPSSASSSDNGRYAARLIIDPGPQFTIRDSGIEWVGSRQSQNAPRTTATQADVAQDSAPAATPPAEQPATPVVLIQPESTASGAVLPVSGTSSFVLLRGSPPVHPEKPIAEMAVEAINLPDGAPGRAPDILAAEARIVSILLQNGFADARAEARYVEVVHPSLDGENAANANTVRPRFNIMPRDLVYLDDEIRLNPARPGTRDADDEDEEPRVLTRTRESWVQALVPWERGDIFSPAALSELERRLTETGVYDSATVSLANLGPRTVDVDGDGLRDVNVYLSDRKHKLLEAGASYATKDGFGLDIYRTHFNRFGRADTLRYGLRIANIDSRVGAEWSRPHFRKPGRTFRTSAWAINELTDAYERQAISVDAEISQRWGATSSYSLGLGIDGGRYKETRYDPIDAVPVVMDRNLIMLTARGGAYIDRSNDPLNATKGWRARVSVQPTAVTGEDTVFFLRSVGEGSAYFPVGERERTILAGRLKIGSIIGGDELTVPSDRLMFSGGGGSVRGYSYQSINPRLPDNTPRGGLSLFETSFEVRQDIGEKFQAVAFIDGGAVGFQETPNLSNMRYGAGVGVRYKLPFGPVRADIAIPLNKREGDSEFQLYISIGQSF